MCNVMIWIAYVMEGCMWLLYWKDASHNTLDYYIEGMHLNTLDYCIGGIHLTIH